MKKATINAKLNLDGAMAPTINAAGDPHPAYYIRPVKLAPGLFLVGNPWRGITKARAAVLRGAGVGRKPPTKAQKAKALRDHNKAFGTSYR